MYSKGSNEIREWIKAVALLEQKFNEEGEGNQDQL